MGDRSCTACLAARQGHSAPPGKSPSDVWWTWCSPCGAAIKKIKRLKNTVDFLFYARTYFSDSAVLCQMARIWISECQIHIVLDCPKNKQKWDFKICKGCLISLYILSGYKFLHFISNLHEYKKLVKFTNKRSTEVKIDKYVKLNKAYWKHAARYNVKCNI